jgi:uncharacterized protein YcbK (DUF882 family)
MTKFLQSEAKKYIDWSWPDFSPKEFACKCCGELLFTKESVAAWDAIQEFRSTVKTPVIINSAYRCESHNTSVGGAKESQHLKGIAFDIRITPELPRHVIHSSAKKAGFKGFGDYDTFVHIDTGRARSWKG